MKTLNKNEVIQALKSNVSPAKKFNSLLQLFMQHPHKAPGAARFYNSAGFSKERLANLEYDVQQVYGITKKELMNAPAVKAEKKKEVEVKSFEDLDYHKELKPLAVETAEKLGDELPSMKKADLIEYLNDSENRKWKIDEAEKAIENAPDDVKAGWKIREEYPFLNEDDCPDKMHTLVGKMISAHHKYVEGRKELQALESEDKDAIFKLAKPVVENFELNKEIKAELDYYKEHGEILGNHPIFEEEMLQKRVDDYKEADLKGIRGNLRSYISKNTKKLEKAKDEAAKAEIQKKLDDWQAEIDLIEKRLGDDKK